METLLGILLLAALIVLMLFGNRLASIGTKALNKNVLFKSEFADGEKLVNEELSFECTASLQDIKNNLDSHVEVEETIPFIKGGLFKESESPDLIIYAFGNRVNPQMFQAALSLDNSGTTTRAIFGFLRWQTSGGMILQRDNMKKLRDEVYAAFTAADPAVKVIGKPNK